jgi:hypothetical protein
MSFDELFRRNADGTISPRIPVHINGVTMVPGGEIGGGVNLGGVDLTQFVDMDLDVEIQEGVHAIRGIYN